MTLLRKTSIYRLTVEGGDLDQMKEGARTLEIQLQGSRADKDSCFIEFRCKDDEAAKGVAFSMHWVTGMSGELTTGYGAHLRLVGKTVDRSAGQ